jgi:NAD-dependent SIR2 family protein deacetylase
MKKSRESVVLFVGAGASRACGYPTNDEILPEILRRLRENAFHDEHIDPRRAELRRFLSRLLPPPSSGTPLPQITEVLSILDHCIENGEELFASGRKELKLADARWLLDRAVGRVIKCIHLKGRDVKPSAILDWIKATRRRGADVSVISTNYDFSLDGELFDDLDDWSTDYAKTDFGFTWRDPDDGELVHPSSNPKMRLYKLHGSLNWLNCPLCGNTYVNFMRTLVTLADSDGEWSTCHCGFGPLRAVLVAPSFVRRYRDRNILSIWRSASELLREADRWVMVGYSFPPEDIALRTLFLRTHLSRRRTPQIQVVSHGDSALCRYRQLFPHCEYTGDGLKAFLDGTAEWNRPRLERSGRSALALSLASPASGPGTDQWRTL